MNILFFLTPKNDVVCLYDTFTVRQAMEKMEYHRYTSVPVLNKKGEYVGTLTEGDILWTLRSQGSMDAHDAEQIPISDIKRKAHYKPVYVDTDMRDLLEAAATQNFVPVLDGKNSFIGIITRTAIMQYCIKHLPKEQPAPQPAASLPTAVQ